MTIGVHKSVIKKGYVWFGKLGSCISKSSMKKILGSKEPRILMLKIGTKE